ncbi:MAG: glycosyltransferase [Candidatus Dependentiae bacterium]|nr:glycosyltransferase [Candidatus Dependentiae bacterium]
MVIFLLFLLAVPHVIGANNELKTSIIIPCSSRHAVHLYDLLKLYEAQTVLPDEVVISLSDVHLVERHIIDKLCQQPWRFCVQLLITPETLFAGPNRNRACEYATGDILICQDADDLPHPQRVEIITYFFKKYNVDHLMHGFSFTENMETMLQRYQDLSHIPFVTWQPFEDLFERFVFHNGNIAIKKNIWEKIKWSSLQIGEDAEFNREVYEYTTRCIALEIPLLVYRIALSATVIR